MTDKATARRKARQARRRVDFAAVSPRVVAALGAWEGLAGDPVVLLYVPLPDEVDVTPLAGNHAVIPRLHDDGTMTLHPWASPRERHPLGFEQPAAGVPEVDPATVDVALLPGLAFAGDGTRLGRGGGHYDRLLPRLRPGVPVVGIAPDAAIVASLPFEAHDVRVTHLASESGVRAVGRFPAVTDDIVARANAWIAADPDPGTRRELQAIVEAGDGEALASRMQPLTFGTAGIRGEIGAGPGRMNRAVVIRTTRGLADHLTATGHGGGEVVVGYDGRSGSRRFAEDTVGVLLSAGFSVTCFDATTPTPLIAHAARTRGAVAAVVITASHNPPRDNGYKVYDASGAQIVPPVDAAIAAAIAAVGPADAVPRDDAFPGRDPEPFVQAYQDDVLAWRGSAPDHPTIPIIYTAMHGVGGHLTLRLLEAAGHDRVIPVAEQQEPDGGFPTVAFPNPEEPGALDLAEALADREQAALVLANDPDADRLGVAVPEDGGWRQLTGNEIGVLLADLVLSRTTGSDRLVVTTVVSTPMLAAVAAHHGVSSATTLTGFKWICAAARDLEAEGARLVFGFEEALGYTIGPVVRDKDGMAAAVWFADLAASCAASGETVLDRLADLFVRDGLWVSHPLSLRRQGPDAIAGMLAAVDHLAADPPSAVGGMAVTGVTDYSRGAETRPRWLPATPLVELTLAGGSRVLVRPSGTEPKLKIYTDVRAEAPDRAAVPAVRASALALAGRIAADLAGILA